MDVRVRVARELSFRVVESHLPGPGPGHQHGDPPAQPHVLLVIEFVRQRDDPFAIGRRILALMLVGVLPEEQGFVLAPLREVAELKSDQVVPVLPLVSGAGVVATVLDAGSLLAALHLNAIVGHARVLYFFCKRKAGEGGPGRLLCFVGLMGVRRETVTSLPHLPLN